MSSFILIRDDNRVESTRVVLPDFYRHPVNHSFVLMDYTDKMAYFHGLIETFKQGKQAILFDTAMVNAEQKASLIVESESSKERCDGIAIFFTSGTTGNAIGVVKSKEHIESEIAVHRQWLGGYKFEQCLVCVPLFHIYGFLFGFALPLSMELDIIIQEHFLPGDIIAHALKKPTLCIANPVFIRAMNRMRADVDLSRCIFICSAGPLEHTEASLFESKYNTRLVQLYGSTETGGIAIRQGGEEKWTPLEGVRIGESEGRLWVQSPFLSECIYDEKFSKIDDPYLTTDLVRIENESFEIIGRESELIKIGGKRLSVVEIERALEDIDEIDEVLVSAEYHPRLLRGEVMHLKICSRTDEIDSAKIKKFLHDRFGGIHIECTIERVSSIFKTATGKKIRSVMSLEKGSDCQV